MCEKHDIELHNWSWKSVCVPFACLLSSLCFVLYNWPVFFLYRWDQCLVFFCCFFYLAALLALIEVLSQKLLCLSLLFDLPSCSLLYCSQLFCKRCTYVFFFLLSPSLLQEKPLSRSLQRGEDAQFDQVSKAVMMNKKENLDHFTTYWWDIIIPQDQIQLFCTFVYAYGI